MIAKNSRIVPVVLSGGSGTRLWPMSTPETPKQFLPLTGEKTMFQLTLARCADADRFAPPLIVANVRHASLIKAQMEQAGLAAASVILEPTARNTAPAIAFAAIEAGNAPILVMPSDHVIADNDAFLAAIALALPLAEQGWLVTFGITPDGPETGYGYIKADEAIEASVRRVERFVEKPDRAKAEAMLTAGKHYWNGGIFLFRGDVYLEALSQFAPAIREAAEKAMARARRKGSDCLPDAEAFAASPSDSIDYAVMEKAEKVAVVPVTMGWSDVGSWDALYSIGECDESGNVARGPVRLEGTGNSLIQSDGIRISAGSVKDLIVIASGSEVLILPRGQSQDAKKFSA